MVSSHYIKSTVPRVKQLHYRSVYVTIIIHRYAYKDNDKDLNIGLQEFVVGYSKATEQPQSSARPICHSLAMTRMGREPATISIAA